MRVANGCFDELVAGAVHAQASLGFAIDPAGNRIELIKRP
jgi:hypothetical protein